MQGRGPSKLEAPGNCPLCPMVNPALLLDLDHDWVVAYQHKPISHHKLTPSVGPQCRAGRLSI